MKHRFFTALTAACMLTAASCTDLPVRMMPAVTVSAETLQFGDYTYERSGDSGIITAFDKESADTEIEIPAEIEGLPVTGISDEAFIHCTKLTAVTIPESVTVIGENAFYGCSALKEVVLPAYLEEISYSSFNGTPWFKAQLAENPVLVLGTVLVNVGAEALAGIFEIPAGVTALGDKVLGYNDIMTGVIFPDTLRRIGTGTFSGCFGLTELHLPESLTYLGDYAFADCNKVAAFDLPEGITHIGSSAFIGCGSLTEITLPPLITVIEPNTFNACEALKKITIPKGVTEIGDGAFKYDVLTDVYFGGSKAEWNAITVGTDNEGLLAANIHFGEDSAYETGDVDGDGEVTSADAQLTLTAYLEGLVGNGVVLTAEQTAAADIDSDGTITASDAQLILVYYLRNTIAKQPTSWEQLLAE